MNSLFIIHKLNYLPEILVLTRGTLNTFFIENNLKYIIHEVLMDTYLVKFGAGEGIRILNPLNLCFMGSQKLKNLIAT